VTDEVVYMSATEEDAPHRGPGQRAADENGKFENDLVNTRQSGEYTLPRARVST
jgi:DNA-directed RNA polymerase subunit beta